MRYSVLLFCTLFSFRGFSQSEELTKQLGKSILVCINPPLEVVQDSCYYSITMVKVNVDRKYTVTGIDISDGSAMWLKEDQKKLMKRIPSAWLKKINELLRTEKIRKGSILIPLYIQSTFFPCDTVVPETLVPGRGFLLFNGKPPSGRLFVCRSIGMSNSLPKF